MSRSGSERQTLSASQCRPASPIHLTVAVPIRNPLVRLYVVVQGWHVKTASQLDRRQMTASPHDGVGLTLSPAVPCPQRAAEELTRLHRHTILELMEGHAYREGLTAIAGMRGVGFGDSRASILRRPSRFVAKPRPTAIGNMLPAYRRRSKLHSHQFFRHIAVTPLPCVPRDATEVGYRRIASLSEESDRRCAPYSTQPAACYHQPERGSLPIPSNLHPDLSTPFASSTS
ncbi:hypothetical protein BDV96DRAFT_596523 [Lophiotrema nucula]|uniref:Uncharacterized protein n=1 Tax=Lophiotrema nucula TaxID=690887 RepID=A0A6A5ZHX7_9PLEO|nr:hypothetical protein BDV96DRAFT_596523 [Lophiotrema nucula]